MNLQLVVPQVSHHSAKFGSHRRCGSECNGFSLLLDLEKPFDQRVT